MGDVHAIRHKVFRNPSAESQQTWQRRPRRTTGEPTHKDRVRNPAPSRSQVGGRAEHLVRPSSPHRTRFLLSFFFPPAKNSETQPQTQARSSGAGAELRSHLRTPEASSEGWECEQKASAAVSGRGAGVSRRPRRGASRPSRRGHRRPKLRLSPAVHPHSATRQLTGIPRNSSSSARRRRARTGAGRRGPARPPPSARSGPGPVAPCAAVRSSSRAGARTALPPSALLLFLLLLRAAGKQIPISAASAAEYASSRRGGRGGVWGRGGPGEQRRRARALERTRQLCAHPPRGAGPAPDTNGAESSAEVPEGPVELGAPLPGRRAGGRHGGARLPREGGPAFRARRPHPRDGGAAGTGLRGVDSAGTPLHEPKLGPHVRSCGVAPKALSSRSAGSVARWVCDRKEK